MKVDPPILTGSAPEGTTELFFIRNTLMRMRIYHKVVNCTWKLQQWRSEGYFSFGPTFRAEKVKKTRRHLIEFWMIEPEMAFMDHEDNLRMQENYVSYLVQSVLQNCALELKKH
ncbi:hypothetical protein GCM10020331_067130 [Ectobacillus funiculus]